MKKQPQRVTQVPDKPPSDGKPEYYINAKGEHVMSYPMFQSASVHSILQTLGVQPRPKKPKTKKQRKEQSNPQKES